MPTLRALKNRSRKKARIVMERLLSRKLQLLEVVHHIDGNPLNNEESNLEIREFGEHSRFHRLQEANGKTYNHKKYMKNYNKAHRQELNAYMRQYRKDHPKRIKKIKHKSYLKCRVLKSCPKRLCPSQDQARRVSAQSLKAHSVSQTAG